MARVTQSHGGVAPSNGGRRDRRDEDAIGNDLGTPWFRRPREAWAGAYSRMMNGVAPTGVLKR